MKLFLWFRLLRADLRAMISLAVPIVIANIGHVVMGETDKIMLRNLGVIAIDAAGFSTSIFYLVAVLGIGTLSVIAPQTAAALGMKDNLVINRMLKSGVRLGWTIGIILCGILMGFVQYLFVFGQSAEVTSQAQLFLTILAISIIPMMVFLSLKFFADGLSYTRVDMFITLAAVLLNLFLNWALVYGNAGFPKMGLLGSAIATLVSRIGMATAAYLYVFRAKEFKDYHFSQAKHTLEPYLIKIVRQGFPAGLQYFFESGAFSCAVIMMGWISKYAQAAHIIAIGPASFTYMMMAGVAAASAIRVGKYRGEGNRKGILRAGTVSLVVVAGFMTISCIAFVLFPNLIIELYINTEEVKDAVQVIPLATALLIIAGFFQLSDGIQVVGLNNLRGIEDVRIPTFITLLSYWIIGLPLGWVLGFPLGMQAAGVWIGLTAGLTASAIMLTYRFYHLAGKIRLRWSPKNLWKKDEKSVEV
jgi:MATE family multidrug resistance protein